MGLYGVHNSAMIVPQDGCTACRISGMDNLLVVKGRMSYKKFTMSISSLFQKAVDFHNLAKLDDAIAVYREVLQLDDRYHPAWYALGCAFQKKREDAAALECYEKAISIVPNLAESHHNLGNVLHKLGLIDEAIEQFRTAIGLGRGFLPRTAIATLIPGSPKADNQVILQARRAWAETHLPPPDPNKKLARASAKRCRLRVGYLSSFFQSHNWMKPVWGLINHHDREHLEVHIFSDAPEAACGGGYRKHPTDQFHDITQLTNCEAAERIEKCNLDLLVDLNGYSRIDRLAVVALKPAPVIAGWFNLYATSGMLCYDYLIGDEEVIKAEEEKYYTEKVLRVPGCYLTFEVSYPVPEIVDPPVLSEGMLTFGCLASQYKITEPVVEAWSRILLSTQGTRLFLKNASLGSASNRQFLTRRFVGRGVTPDRIVMEGPAEHFDYLAAYAHVDVALDTFPYNGGTTTSEAVWQGVPVLTFPGDRWASRQSTSINRAAGLDIFIAKDLDDYVACAVALAGSADTPRRLAGLRHSMRSRLASAPICDTVSFARNMEQLYREMVEAQVPTHV